MTLDLMKSYEKQTYALMRIMAGFLFLWHGTSKYLSFPRVSPAEGFVLVAGGGIELFGGLLIMIGLFTSPAAFIASGHMAAAYWISHGTNQFFPILNQGELAALFCFVFLFISSKGDGIWSVQNQLKRQKLGGQPKAL
jgi:putative oxidoreductase